MGLGWSLNAGGACTVNCIDDKHGNFESRLIDTMTEKEIEEYMENFGIFQSKSRNVIGKLD